MNAHALLNLYHKAQDCASPDAREGEAMKMSAMFDVDRSGPMVPEKRHTVRSSRGKEKTQSTHAETSASTARRVSFTGSFAGSSRSSTGKAVAKTCYLRSEKVAVLNDMKWLERFTGPLRDDVDSGGVCDQLGQTQSADASSTSAADLSAALGKALATKAQKTRRVLSPSEVKGLALLREPAARHRLREKFDMVLHQPAVRPRFLYAVRIILDTAPREQFLSDSLLQTLLGQVEETDDEVIAHFWGLWQETAVQQEKERTNVRRSSNASCKGKSVSSTQRQFNLSSRDLQAVVTAEDDEGGCRQISGAKTYKRFRFPFQVRPYLSFLRMRKYGQQSGNDR